MYRFNYQQFSTDIAVYLPGGHLFYDTLQRIATVGTIGWLLVGYGSLRQYYSLHQAVFQRERERALEIRLKTNKQKNKQTNKTILIPHLLRAKPGLAILLSKLFVRSGTENHTGPLPPLRTIKTSIYILWDDLVG